MSLSIEVAAGTDVGCVRDNNKDNSGYDRRHTLYRFVREWVDGLPGRSPAGSLSALCWSILTGHAKVGNFPEVVKHLESRANHYPILRIRIDSCRSTGSGILQRARPDTAQKAELRRTRGS